MPRELLESLWEYLQQKHNFMTVAALASGASFAVVELWMFGRHGGPGWWVFLVVIALGAGWVWAYFMWFAWKDDTQRSSSRPETQKTDKRIEQ